MDPALNPNSALEPKRCLKCRYILDNLPEPRCPECGLGFDPQDPATYWIKRHPNPDTPWLIAAVAGAASAGLMLANSPFMPLVIAGVGVNVIVFVRSLVAVVDRRTRGRRLNWAIAMTLSLLHVVGCGGFLTAIQPLWNADLPG